MEAFLLEGQSRHIAPGGKNIHKAEIYLIVALLVFGIAVCFLLPIGGGYDEETHLMRVWEMSSYAFVPNERLGVDLNFPAVYWDLSYRRQMLIRTVEADFWEKYGSLAIDANDYIYGDLSTRSVYSPPLLLPQALVMRLLGRSWQLPALTVYYACRLVGLLSYIFLTWLAVRFVPFGKWILAILATTPVAILQAVTISADSISNGIAFLFIGGTLAVAQRKEIRWKEWAFLAILFFILFWGKLNLVPLAILPFLVIRPSKFKMRYGYLILLVTTLALLLLEVVGWSLLAYSELRTPPEGTDPVGQVKFFFTQPLVFIPILAKNVWMNSLSYMRGWIAIYGFDYWPVPIWTYYLYIASFVTALIAHTNDERPDSRTRWGLLIVFAITYLATIVSLYITFNPVGFDLIDGVQGRYFTTVMPLLFLALAGFPFVRQFRVPALFPVILAVLGLTLYCAGMYLSYYVPCGSQYYQPGLCYQPRYKNWSPDEVYSPPITNQLTITQELVSECDGMTELRVWLNTEGAAPDGRTQFFLKDMDFDREVLNESVANSTLPVKSWFALNFEPDWDSDGKFYLLTISSDDQDVPGPRVAYSLRQEYRAGKLFENDQRIDKDVLFQVGCIAGFDIPR